MLFSDGVKLLCSVGADPAKATLVVKALFDLYDHPDRHYHNLDHVTACLRSVAWLQFDREAHKSFQLGSGDIKVIEAALLFHDAIYDPRRQDNEEASAAFFKKTMADLNVKGIFVEEAMRAILATQHGVGTPGSLTSKWVVDIDLGIFYTDENVFDTYEKYVRREYDFVEDAAWITGRSKVLQSFLDREWIYTTPLYRRLYEGTARGNIKRSLARLEKGEVLR